jgi:hypothetical protein
VWLLGKHLCWNKRHWANVFGEKPCLHTYMYEFGPLVWLSDQESVFVTLGCFLKWILVPVNKGMVIFLV